MTIDANAQPQWDNTSNLAERMKYYKAPGASIAVIDEYKLAWTKGYGVRTASDREIVTAQTPFHTGSVAKSISAARSLLWLNKVY